MQVKISTQHFSLSEGLRNHIQEQLTALINKYFDHDVSHTFSPNVHFSKENSGYSCNIVININIGSSNVIKSNVMNLDIHSSFDQALAKSEKQLREYKRQMKEHHGIKPATVDIA